MRDPEAPPGRQKHDRLIWLKRARRQPDENARFRGRK